MAAFADPDAARAEIQIPEMIRVRLSVSGQNFRAILPAGAVLAIDGSPVALPNGDATLGIAPGGWRLGIPENSPDALLAVAGEDSDGLLRPVGLFSDRTAAERARRQPAADYLAQSRDVGEDAKHLLCSTRGRSEALHLIEYQQYVQLPGQLTYPL